MTVPQLLEEWLTPVERFCECSEVPEEEKAGRKKKQQASDDFFFVSMIKKNVCKGKMKKKKLREMKTTVGLVGTKKFLLQSHDTHADTRSIVYA